MSDVFTNRQRVHTWTTRGRPVLSLEFDVFAAPNGRPAVSMWTHTRHAIPFHEMQAAFEAIREHLQAFLDDGAMCPFHPDFVQDASTRPHLQQEDAP